MSPANSPLQRPPMFRRRRFVATHRRPGLVRNLLRPLGMALAIVGAPAALAVWTLTSPHFALADIEVESGRRVPAGWVIENLAPLRGRHVLLLALPEVERLLGGHRWVHGVQVRKKLPNSLVVEVLERIPVAVLRHGEALHYVDSEGLLIDQLESAHIPAALLVIDADPERRSAVAAAVAAIDNLAGRESKLFEAVLTAEVLTGQDVKLHLAGLPFALLVRIDRLDPAVADFERLLPKLMSRYEDIAAVDLRFSRQIVMQFPEA